VELAFGSFALTLFDDLNYTPDSVDNERQYDREYCFVEEYRPVSQYGVVCTPSEGTRRSCILLAGGGASRVHDHSAVIVGSECFIGVGDMLCSLWLPTLDLKWSKSVDEATCFGVYYCPEHRCLLSHGELVIARVSLSGDIVWSASGKDIFTEGFQMVGDYIKAIDFNQEVYRINIVTGHCEVVQAQARVP
jgi:hypothetical protein